MKEHFTTHNRNDLDFIKLNSLPSCLICFPLEKQSTETYTAYTIYYFDQAYFESDFEEKNNTTETPFETEEESYQTAPIFDLLSSKSDSSTQTVTPEPMANDPMQANILAALQGNAQDPIEWLDDFEKAATANQYDEEYKFQIVGGYFQGSPTTWFSQETNTNTPINAGEENTSFTIRFKAKFRTPILISKWHMELERRTQGLGEVVTEYAKAIRKLIKCTEEQKIYSFTKGLRTDLSYALWPLLALKDNPTIDMAIELAQ
ncbi:hypothetical protein G9A89_023552 [Geosiphon pyriformis]|nr:hypothetical protein G9A89_023552 [Geosiphon pyriformis]